MDFNLRDKNVIITGASGQIGSHLVEEFRQRGSNVIDIDVNNCNVSNSDEVQDFFNSQFEEHKSIDVLINNAGISTFDNFIDRKDEDFNSVLSVNLNGTFNCIKSYVNNFDKANQGKGSIINVGSVYGSVSSDPRIYTDCSRVSPEVYGATKAGIIQMTKYFAVHLADRRIRVNCISPGGVYNGQGDDFVKNYSDRCPMNRMACVDDLHGAFLFFASNMSSYITGQNLLVDGGFTSW